MLPSNTGFHIVRRAGALVFLVASLTLAGCAPFGEMLLTPKWLTVVSGGTVTTRVTTFAYCGGDACRGPLVEYVVQNVPPQVTYTVDTSLQSPSTPGVASITFAAAPDIAIENHFGVLVHAVLDGHVIATDTIRLHVLPATSSPPLPGAAGVAAGGEFSSAVLSGGMVASWGRNDFGQLGLGDGHNRSSPTVVAGLPSIVAAAAGLKHTLAVTDSGEVWAWGDNADGQTGNGNLRSQPAPARVTTLANIRAVAAGPEHSLALEADGTVWAWGKNHHGELGEGAALKSPTPVRVRGLPAARGIGATEHSSLAVALDGTVWAWGDELGAFSGSATPWQVAGLENILAISVHSRAALALDVDGGVWGWGHNGYGRLGTGTADDRVVGPVRLVGPTNVAAIALGRSLGLAVTATGELWQWGQGQSDSSDPDPRWLVPRRVAELNEVAAISAGENHALAALRCGQVWAWGGNGYRQLGSSIEDSRSETPVLVGGIGNDSGCARVGLRILSAGDIPANPIVIGSIAESPWYGRPYTSVLERGASVSVTVRTPIDQDGNRFAFVRWAGDCDGSDLQLTIVLERSKVCTAIYERVSPDPALLSVISSGGVVTSDPLGILGPSAIDCGETCSAIFPRNTTVGLAATPASGFAFTGWADACAGTAPETTVLMDERKTCEARFRPFRLDLTTSDGGRVISEPAGIDCGSTCSIAPGVGAVRLLAIPALGWRLAQWGGDCAGSTPELGVTMDRDKSCTATFERISNTFVLTVIADGQGVVTSQPAGISCPGVCTALFDEGTRVVLTAQPAPGWEVSFWLEDCVAAGSLTREVVIDADKTCRARITPQPAYPVARIQASTVAGTARLGEVVTFNGLQSHMFDPVTGLPDAAAIRSLAWDLDSDGALDDAFGNRATAGITQYAFQTLGSFAVRLRVEGGPFDLADVDERTITVLPATATLHELMVTKAGAGQGAIVTSPLGLLSCGETCTGLGPLLLDAITTVTLMAQPAPGSIFAGWTGTGCAGTAPAIPVAMTEPRTCTARFEPVQFPLTVTRSAGGSVTSLPPGILCGSNCGASFPSGTTAVLTALPDAGFTFGTWSGCDIVLSNQCTVAILEPRTVDVTFVPLPGPFTLSVVLTGPGGPLGRVFSVVPQGAIDCGVSFGTACAATVSASTLLVVRPDDWTIENNRFDGWSGCDVVGALFTCTVTMTSHRTIVATFKP